MGRILNSVAAVLWASSAATQKVEVTVAQTIAAAIHSEMKKGAKLILIDFREGDLPEGPPEFIKVPKAEVVQMCKQAGFRLQEDRSELLPYQNYLVFVKL
jgi:hypothetical protein